jgi:3-oxoacyl-[acyl-carrier protein] reductase
MTSLALVTGGASGIGAATVSHLAGRGYAVVVADLNLAAAEEHAATLVLETGAIAVPVACDVTSPSQVEAMVAVAADVTGRIDAVVSCAGFAGPSGRLEVLSLEDWSRVVDVNLWGVAHVSRAVAPLLRRQRSGSIVNVASVAGLQGSRGQVAYSASKAAVIGLTQAMAKELLTFGVRATPSRPASSARR